MGRSLFETIMGAIVLIVALGFMWFAYQGSSLKPVEGYALKAKFITVAGIGIGTDVRIGGIKVGVVSDMSLDAQSYQAVIVMQIKNAVKIPADSSASVVSDGLLGNKYIKIEPGAEDRMLAANDTIAYTQSSVNLEELIGKMAFSGGGVDKNAGKKEPAPSSGPAPAATAPMAAPPAPAPTVKP